jgi:DNA-binding MarR family transcriptional regulator
MPTVEYLTTLCKSYYDFKYSLFKVIDSLCKPEKLTGMQAMLLFMLRSEGAVSVGSLSSLLNITQSNASALCKKLEKDGLIARTRSKSDERTVLITLAENGNETLDRMLKRGAKISASLEEIPVGRLDTIVETLDEATALLTKLMDK